MDERSKSCYRSVWIEFRKVFLLVIVELSDTEKAESKKKKFKLSFAKERKSCHRNIGTEIEDNPAR